MFHVRLIGHVEFEWKIFGLGELLAWGSGPMPYLDGWRGAERGKNKKAEKNEVDLVRSQVSSSTVCARVASLYHFVRPALLMDRERTRKRERERDRIAQSFRILLKLIVGTARVHAWVVETLLRRNCTLISGGWSESLETIFRSTQWLRKMLLSMLLLVLPVVPALTMLLLSVSHGLYSVALNVSVKRL